MYTVARFGNKIPTCTYPCLWRMELSHLWIWWDKNHLKTMNLSLLKHMYHMLDVPVNSLTLMPLPCLPYALLPAHHDVAIRIRTCMVLHGFCCLMINMIDRADALILSIWWHSLSAVLMKVNILLMWITSSMWGFKFAAGCSKEILHSSICLHWQNVCRDLPFCIIASWQLILVCLDPVWLIYHAI